MNQSISCPGCASTALEDQGKIPDGLLLRCRDCGTLTLDRDVSQTAVSVEEYGSAYRDAKDQKKSRLLLDLLRRATEGEPSSRRTLLDIGCGEGAFLQLAVQDHWDVMGIDSDTEAICMAADIGLRAVHGELGGALPDLGTFNVVTLWDVIEHVVDIHAAMEWLSHTVAVGGQLIILTPNADSALDTAALLERRLTLDRSQKIVHLCLNRYHRHRFTVAGLAALVKRYGFVPIQMESMMLYSLSPDRYLSGFAPGMPSWTRNFSTSSLLSKVSYRCLKLLRIKNKLFMTCLRTKDPAIHSIIKEQA